MSNGYICRNEYLNISILRNHIIFESTKNLLNINLAGLWITHNFSKIHRGGKDTSRHGNILKIAIFKNGSLSSINNHIHRHLSHESKNKKTIDYFSTRYIYIDYFSMIFIYLYSYIYFTVIGKSFVLWMSDHFSYNLVSMIAHFSVKLEVI